MGGRGTAAVGGRSVAGSVPGLEELWAATTGDPRVRVAVLDGPVDLGHPCFSGASLKPAPTLASGGTAGGRAPSEHGTHVASILFGRHDGPVPGVAPGCAGWILPVFSATPDGGVQPCSQLDLARAIHEAVRLGARVINISGGELQDPSQADPYLHHAVEDATRSGALIVSAVGNDGCECAHVPAALPGVLAVGGVDREGRPLPVSNWGEPLSRQGILAPAAEILGATPGGGTATRTGTSFATPIVSGVAALLLSLQIADGRSPDAAAVRAALLESASRCRPESAPECARFLAGLLDLPAARALLGLDRRSVAVPRVTAAAAGPAGAAPAGRVPMPSRPEEAGEPENGLAGVAARTPDQPGPITGGEPVMNEQPTGGHDPAVHAGSAPAIAACAATPASATPPSTPSSHGPAAVGPGADSGQLPSESEAANAGGDVRPACACQGGGGLVAGGRSAHLAPPGTGAAPATRPSQAGGQGDLWQGSVPQQSLAFVLGRLGYDFGTEARRDYFVSQIDPESPFKVYNPVEMANYLGHIQHEGLSYWEELFGETTAKQSHPEDANALIWTLVIDQEPVYAILPQDQYAAISFFSLVQFLWDQEHEEVDRVAVAGTVTGAVRLLNGAVVPTIAPVTRGLFDWNIKALYEALKGGEKGGDKESKEKKKPAANDGEGRTEAEFRSFLVRVYEELRNLGVSSSDRALNFAATNAFQVYHIFKDACEKGLRLDKFNTRRSPICRRDSDCWDVGMLFFDPKKLIEQARRFYQFTIDVSDVVPVQVGDLRQYDVYTDPFGG